MIPRVIPAEELERLFDAAVPRLFQRDVLQHLLNCYQEAETIRDRYSLHRTVAEWHAPLGRRALIESQLFDVAGRYGLPSEFRSTKNHSSQYLAIRAGQFVITESKVDEAGRLPREADFRTENSLVNCDLFDHLEAAPQLDSPIYAILAHVPCPGETRPVCVHWLFPDSKYTIILHRIDLLARFSVPGEQPPASESPAVDPTPRLRKKAAGKGEAQA